MSKNLDGKLCFLNPECCLYCTLDEYNKPYIECKDCIYKELHKCEECLFYGDEKNCKEQADRWHQTPYFLEKKGNEN
jgi:hypothetical protein